MIGEAIRRVLATGLGLAVLTKEKAEELVNEFVRQGELSREEGERLLDDITRRAQEQSGQLRAMIDQRLRSFMDGSGFVRKEELLALERRIEALESRLADEES